jgi:hypothetical protein
MGKPKRIASGDLESFQHLAGPAAAKMHRRGIGYYPTAQPAPADNRPMTAEQAETLRRLAKSTGGHGTRRARNRAVVRPFGAPSDGHADGVPEMTYFTPFFEFVLVAIGIGSLALLLTALLLVAKQ